MFFCQCLHCSLLCSYWKVISFQFCLVIFREMFQHCISILINLKGRSCWNQLFILTILRYVNLFNPVSKKIIDSYQIIINVVVYVFRLFNFYWETNIKTVKICVIPCLCVTSGQFALLLFCFQALLETWVLKYQGYI